MLLINVNIIVAILTLAGKMTGIGDLNLKFPLILAISVFLSRSNFMLM